jgi:hypothetical protein
MTLILDRRVRELRARVLIRSWNYRQRRHARGAWGGLRRALAGASAAYAIPSDEARKLIAEGHRAEPVGHQLEPPKLIVFARTERIAQIADARSLPVRLSAELLAAECLALTAFDTAS